MNFVLVISASNDVYICDSVVYFTRSQRCHQIKAANISDNDESLVSKSKHVTANVEN